MKMLVRVLTLGVAIAMSAVAQAQTQKAWARVSFFGDAASTTQESGLQSSFGEMMANVTFQSAVGDTVPYEYRADIRMAAYPTMSNRSRRISVYDAYVGVHVAAGNATLRVGEMWLNELGGLGQLGGAMFEVRQPQRVGHGRWRAALFGGLEPKILDIGFVSDVYKFGGLVAYDGQGARRSVVGFVAIRDKGRAERTVLLTNNFLPIGRRIFVYQVAEYDLRGPGVDGAGSLTYLFVNGRYTPNDVIEFQGTFHRGRSIDSRSIIQDQLDGRPVDPRALDGLRYESVSGRVTLRLMKQVRVFGGYGQDRNNRDDSTAGRLTYGLFASNIARTGLDVTFTDSRINRGTAGSYDSWYVSLGRSFGSHVYLTGDYGSSLSVLRFTSSSGFVIETRPRTRRLAFSGVFNVGGGTSLLVTAERILDSGSTQTRVMSGITYRFIP
jgi:hypothetical protein